MFDSGELNAADIMLGNVRGDSPIQGTISIIALIIR